MASNPAEERLKDRLKSTNSRWTICALVGLALVYGYFFLPEAVFEFVKSRLNSVIAALTSVGLLGLLGAVVGSVVASQDLLATVGTPAAKFFQSRRPSMKIQAHYQCPKNEADALWFGFFNPWEDPKHPRHEYWRRTLERGYQCRFLYQLRAVVLLFVLPRRTHVGGRANSRLRFPICRRNVRAHANSRCGRGDRRSSLCAQSDKADGLFRALARDKWASYNLARTGSFFRRAIGRGGG